MTSARNTSKAVVPWRTLFSSPSSSVMTNGIATQTPPGHCGSGGWLHDGPSLGLELMMVWDSAEAITRINCGGRVRVVLVEENPRLVLKMSERGYGIEIGRVFLSGTCHRSRDNDHARRAS